eukprot:TRINITY_DN6635_c1_g1_i2.p1 TRINITY_DN6635_c1_g1~~TRINITY_DN6635_c1_g1_i2.p1  ORF type:complete len:537 (+),score=96.63 TRINITY_DN6635_c1_g1_i2:62-1672(+)
MSLGQKRPRQEAVDSQEEDELQQELFGGDLTENKLLGKEHHQYTKKILNKNTQEDSFQDDIFSENVGFFEDKKKPKSGSQLNDKKVERKPVWFDPQDEQIQIDLMSKDETQKLRTCEEERVIDGEGYQQRLRKEHKKIYAGISDWANTESIIQEVKSSKLVNGQLHESDVVGQGMLADELIRTAGGEDFINSRGGEIKGGQLEISRLENANISYPFVRDVKSVEFHPGSGRQMMMAAGKDEKVAFYQIDGKKNPCIESIHLEKFSISQAGFCQGGQKVLATSPMWQFYILDLPSGKQENIPYLEGHKQKWPNFAADRNSSLVAFLGSSGTVPIYDVSARQKAFELRMSGKVSKAAFMPGGKELLTAGSDGILYLWDMGTRRCIHRIQDEGSQAAKALSVSPDGNYVASGADWGWVNLYSANTWERKTGSMMASSKTPQRPTKLPLLKQITSLITTVTTLTFNPDSKLLAVASADKKDAMCLVHLPSLTVYQNWPFRKTSGTGPMVTQMAFSNEGEYLAIGTKFGAVQLFCLHHYVK